MKRIAYRSNKNIKNPKVVSFNSNWFGIGLNNCGNCCKFNDLNLTKTLEHDGKMAGGFLNPHDDNPKWPLVVTFEDGTQERYEDEKDLGCNLEFYNSDKDIECNVTDATGKEVYLILHNHKIEELKNKI